MVETTSAKVSSPARQPLCDPGDLAVDSKVAWMYTGAEGPPLACQDSALRDYVRNRALGPQGRWEHSQREERLRGCIAEYVGLGRECIGLLGNASEAINSIVRSLGLEPGDNVVLNDLEYPSVVQPWLLLKERGVEVRIAHHVGWRVSEQSIEALVDERTKVIATSHVSYMSGWRHDLGAISAIADRVGAFVLVDATQSLGVVPVPGDAVDALVASSYKWLLGGHGVGILAWNRRRRPFPALRAVGWRTVADIFTPDRFESFSAHDDARRFEVGYPSFPSIYGLLASMEWLSGFSARQVESHVIALTDRLIRGLREREVPVMTPDDAEHRAGNVAFLCARGEEIAKALAARDILTWAGDGRLRLSVHLFNGEMDVDRALEALDDRTIARLLDRL